MPNTARVDAVSAADRNMFRRLRAKFIVIIMVTMTIVLSAVFATICYSEYHRSFESVTDSLSKAIQHSVAMKAQESSRGNFAPPRIGGRDDERDTTPVAVYLLADDGTLVEQEDATTASISDEVVDDATSMVLASDFGPGKLGSLGLVYLKEQVGDDIYVSFADVSATDGWESLAVKLVVAGLVILAIVFVTSVFFANWALEPVRSAWASQRRFVTDASHDLKTPLTVILANASILLKHPERTIASQSQWIESTQVEAENMQGLINEMLELSHAEEQTSDRFEDVDLSDLVDGEALQFESVAFERGCSFDASIKPAVHIQGDAARLRKMTTTLIDNALKYVGERGCVTVSLDCAGKTARLRVNNTGTPIAPEDLPHLFERFYRSDKARTSGEGGFGLGLAIAQETAHAHGGRIAVSSTSEEGTTFTVELPDAVVRA